MLCCRSSGNTTQLFVFIASFSAFINCLVLGPINPAWNGVMRRRFIAKLKNEDVAWMQWIPKEISNSVKYVVLCEDTNSSRYFSLKNAFVLHKMFSFISCCYCAEGSDLLMHNRSITFYNDHNIANYLVYGLLRNVVSSSFRPWVCDHFQNTKSHPKFFSIMSNYYLQWNRSAKNSEISRKSFLFRNLFRSFFWVLPSN